jgi:predicted ThiF/HesA family dinucleotide-utilizing enzyme
MYFKIIGYVSVDLIHLEQARGPLMGCCTHGNEQFCLINTEDFLHQWTPIKGMFITS